MPVGRHSWIFVFAFLAMAEPLQAQTYSSPTLEKLNQSFRKVYAKARHQALEQAGPIIIAQGDRLTLLHDGDRFVGTSVDPKYHDLKAIAHVPLALYCILNTALDRPLAPSETESLSQLSEALKEAKAELAQAFPEKTIRKRQRRILKRCDAFIAKVLKQGNASSAELDELLDSLRTDITENVDGAARTRIDNYHRQMLAWRVQLSQEQFQQLRVIIPGGAMPRKNNLATAYFAKLFQVEGEGAKIVYAESRFQEHEAMNLLGTHILDSRVGKQFFDDGSRMSRDLLGTAADFYLDSLDFGAFRE